MADNTVINTGSGGDTIATDDIASGVAAGAKVQRIKNGFGADGTYSDVASDNGMPVAGAYTELSGSAAANNTDLIASTDVRGYVLASVQLSGTWSGTVDFQGSNDNTTWYSLSWMKASSVGMSSAPTSNGLYWIPRATRYMRVRTIGYSSGTVTATMGLFTVANWQAVGIQASTNVSLSLSQNLPSSDANSGTVGGHYAAAMAYNGTNWDRMRSFGTLGALGVTPVPGTTGGWLVSSQTALTSTKTQIKATAGNFGGYMIYNPAAAVTYIQVWDVANASITVGTTAPTYVLSIPAGSAANLELTCGVNHATAINVAATTTPTGSTAPATAATATFFYK